MRLRENHAFSKYDFALSLNNISEQKTFFSVTAVTTVTMFSPLPQRS